MSWSPKAPSSAACRLPVPTGVAPRALLGAMLFLGCGPLGCQKKPASKPSPHDSRAAASEEPPAPIGARPNKPDRQQPQAGPANPRSPIGTNLDGISDWSPDWAFVNAFKRARDFISGTEGAGSQWDDERSLDIDPRGYVRSLKPRQVARSLVIWEQPHYPSGQYTIAFEGKGSLSFWPQSTMVSQSSGRYVLQAQGGEDGLGFYISSLPSAGDHIRNLRVLMPGGACEGDPVTYCDASTPCAGDAQCVPFEKTYAEQPFHPKFLQRIKNYSVVRFMDWMNTNHTSEQAWKDRPLVEDARWTKGVPVEVLVKLANLMHQDPWFTMPHAANDEYVREFAKYVRDHLDGGLKAYVEYSNEVWNGIFPQASYASEQGQNLELADDPWLAQLRFYARRSQEVHRIWTSVFGGSERLVRVIASQSANFGASETILEFEDTHKHVDALAIAPYFGGGYGVPENADTWEGRSVDALISDLRGKELDEVTTEMRRQAELARAFNVPLIAYEGGQHLVGVNGAENNEALGRLFDAANRDPRMKEIYLEYLRRWRAAGGQLFVHFTDCGRFGKWGRWGALEYLEQPREQAPKFDALQTFIEKNPRWW